MIFLLKLYFAFVKVGVGGFGGGAASFGLIRHELVTSHELLMAGQAGDCIAAATMLPGPVAVNASALAGFSIAGLPGAVVAVLGLLTAPAALVVLATALLARYSDHGAVSRVRHALRPGALGLVIFAIYTVAESRVEVLSAPVAAVSSWIDPWLPTVLAAATNLPKLVIAAAAFGLFIWRREKLHPAVAIIGFGLLGMLIF